MRRHTKLTGLKRVDLALTRAKWQSIIFRTPNRADLAACTYAGSGPSIRVQVHRNHGFEAVSSATPAYEAWSGINFDWTIGSYDDSLTFGLTNETDVEVVWLDTAQISGLSGRGVGTWLATRLGVLRSRTDNPILLIAWPLTLVDHEHLTNAAITGMRVADLSPLSELLGDRWLDTRTEVISGTRFSNQACLHIARELACCWLPALTIPPRKAIAVDLDGTLYDGVLTENGPLGVHLTDGHRALQQRLCAFRDAGTYLALVTRNALMDVQALFAMRSDFPLHLSDFSAIEASWDQKPNALRRIAANLRIDVESVVFVDDNPGELGAVAESLPTFTVHAKSDGIETKIALEHAAGLFRFQASSDDRLRVDDLRAASLRSQLQKPDESADDYLRSLDVQLDFLVGPGQHLGRLAELCAKTNQFNLSLTRMNETEIGRRLADCPANVVAIRLVDRLCDSGLIGVLVASQIVDTLHIDELCVSCRALGRRVEDTMLTTALALMVAERPFRKVAFSPHQGLRNAPAREWLARYAGSAWERYDDCVEVPVEFISRRPVSSAIRTRIVQCT